MSEKLKIVYRPLQELSPYAHNARTHSPEQVAQLVESIKQFGWTNPVLIDEKGEIIAGHGRVMAAEMLKMDSVPVIVLSGLTDEQKKAYRLADNRLPMNAGWDEDLLRMELSDLINADFDVSLTGFIPTEIDELLTDVLPGIYTALDVVSREQVDFIPAVAKNVKADAAAKDQTVTAPVAPEAKTEDIVPGPSAPNTGDQNIGTVDVKITKSKMAPVKWNGEEQLALGPSGTYNTILADQFKQAFRALANEVEADLGALYFGASRAVGTAGTTPFGVKDDLSDAALARQVLEDNGAPTTDLQMVLGSTAIANLRGKQSVLFKVNESGTEQLLREGVLGRLEGFNIHSSAGVKRAPKVAATGYLVNGEKKEGDVLISIDTGSGSISAGQIVTFAGDPNQYVVAAATSNLITLAAPGLRQDLADDTAITVVGAFTANMAFDRNAFLLASRTPAMPEGGDNADDVMNVTDPISGITFQIALYRQYRQVRYEVGLAWGVSSVKPAHGCLILG